MSGLPLSTFSKWQILLIINRSPSLICIPHCGIQISSPQQCPRMADHDNLTTKPIKNLLIILLHKSLFFKLYLAIWL